MDETTAAPSEGQGTGRLKDRRPPEAVPLTVLTGFLGAGKTTLLNRLVASPELANAVVIINEFGEVAIDHLLVEKQEGGLLTLSSGCLCCTVRGDLIATLEDLIRRRDNDRIPVFDRVVIETTGLADPAPVLNAILMHPYLMLRYRIDGVVTLVDALHGDATLDGQAEAVKQVAMADALVLTKTDLPEGAAAAAALRERLSRLNPTAVLLDAAAGEATAPALLAASRFEAAGRPGLEADRLHHYHDHDHDHDHHDHDGRHAHHHHHHGPHDDAVGSFVLTAEGPLEPPALDIFLNLLRTSHGTGLLRLKGLVKLTDDPGKPLVVQGVQHMIHPARRLTAWPDRDESSRLVLIGRDLDRAAVTRLWSAFFSAPAVDEPDAAALAGPMAAETSPGLF